MFNWLGDAWGGVSDWAGGFFGSAPDFSSLQVLDDPGTSFNEGIGDGGIKVLDDPGTRLDESLNTGWADGGDRPLASGLIGEDAPNTNTGFAKGGPQGQSSLWGTAAKAVGSAANSYLRSSSGSANAANAATTGSLLSAAMPRNTPQTPLMGVTRSPSGTPAATVGGDAVAQWTRIFSGGR